MESLLMQNLEIEDLEDLAWGSAILGSGGGGNPGYELMMAKQQFEENGPPQIVSIENLEDDALIAPVAFMGAPLVGIEKIPSGDEFIKILEMIEKIQGKKVTHLIAGEIGGANAFTPLIVGSKFNLPVIDGDLLGRAFPELQMSSCHLKGISGSPAFMSDALSNGVLIEAKNAYEIERFCRKITVEMGSSAAISFYLMTGKECKEAAIAGTLSQACHIGRLLRHAKEKGKNSLEELLKFTKGKKLGSGTLIDIDQSIQDGFLKGNFTISTDHETIKVHYQNEYLMAYQGETILASTPDVIMALEQETGFPITSESLNYGLRLDLIMIPAPAIWKTEEGLKLVGPSYFGFDQKKENF